MTAKTANHSSGAGLSESHDTLQPVQNYNLCFSLRDTYRLQEVA